MEREDIQQGLKLASGTGKVAAVIFCILSIACIALTLLLICSAVGSFSEEGPLSSVLYFPGIFKWVAFAVACGACFSAAILIAKKETVFTRKIRYRFTVSAALVWIYALIDCIWFPIVERIGYLISGNAFTFEIAQHGLDMGFNFNIGAVFAAAVLTLIASLVHYASLLQQQADELF